MAPEARPRRILLADCDSYFVRCAQLADPEGAGRAELLIVGGRPDGRGVVTSASYAARRYGVHAGMPMARALQLCPRATLAPVPGEMVKRKHVEVRAVLDEFSPVVEAASVDEFYLDLTGTELLYHNEPLEETARRIQAEVRERTEIVVSVGGATSRILAKMAAGVNKPAGIFVVPAGGERDFMLRWDLADLPGVGPSFAEALRRRGVATVRQALPMDLATLTAWIGPARARWLHSVIRGVGSAEVTPRSPQKSVSHERTFPRDLVDEREIETRLLALATETGASLRGEGLKARTVTVRIRYADFTDRSASRTLPEALESDRALFAVARQLLRQLREQRGGGIRLLGVGVSKLGEDEDAEPLLFEAPGGIETERDRKLSEVTDRLRARFGKDAVVPARIRNDLTPRHRGTDEK